MMPSATMGGDRGPGTKLRWWQMLNSLLSLYKSPSVKSIPPRPSWRWCVRPGEGEGQWPWYVMKTDKNNSPNSQRGSRVEVPLVASSAAFRRQTAALSASSCSCSPPRGAISTFLFICFMLLTTTITMTKEISWISSKTQKVKNR